MSITRYMNDPITRVGGYMVPHADGLYVRYADHASAIAEAAEDYANLASTSGDMLKLAVARAEKAEAVAAGKFTLEEIETAFFSHNHGGDEGGEGEYLHRKNVWKSFCRFLDLRIELSLEKASPTPKGTT